MKKRHIMYKSLALILGLGTLTLVGCKPESNVTETTSTRLVVDTTNVKTSFLVGEAFTARNLLVYEVTTVNGEEVREMTTNYRLSIEEGHVLEKTDTEVIVISNDENIKSASYSITVTTGGSGILLSDVINNILETRSYTVNTTLSAYGGIYEIQGRIHDGTDYQGVSWTGDTGGIYQDGDVATGSSYQFGYGVHGGRTFQYRIDENGTAYNPVFVDTMGNYGNDAGIWNYIEGRDTYDARISTYNIFYGLEQVPEAERELEYIQTLEPFEGSTYRFTFDSEDFDHMWIFGLVGDPFDCLNPFYFYEDGYVEITTLADGSLEIQSYNTDDEIPIFHSTVSNIGTTEIEELATFLEDPIFGNNEDPAIAHMMETFQTYGTDLLINKVDGDTRTPLAALKTGYYYYGFEVDGIVDVDANGGIKGTYNALFPSLNCSFIYLDEENTLSYTLNYYWYNSTIEGDEEHIVEGTNYDQKGMDDFLNNNSLNPKLSTFLAHADEYFDTEVEGSQFVVRGSQLNDYIYETLLQFAGYIDLNTVLNRVVLNITSAEEVANEVYTFSLYGHAAGLGSETLLGTFEFTSFGDGTHEIPEAIYNEYNA